MPQTTLSTYARMVRTFLRVEEPVVLSENGALPEDDDEDEMPMSAIGRLFGPPGSLPVSLPHPVQKPLNGLTVIVPRQRPEKVLANLSSSAKVVIRARPLGASDEVPKVKPEPVDEMEEEKPPLLEANMPSTSSATKTPEAPKKKLFQEVPSIASVLSKITMMSSMPAARTKNNTVPHRSFVVLSKLRNTTEGDEYVKEEAVDNEYEEQQVRFQQCPMQISANVVF